MSTFNGLVSEFPDIRIDFFRPHADAPPPLACFLSHVHSDHLSGLETLRSPFVYCSAATREILLRLERYPCRINYARGILEARQQTYKHLSRAIKPLPLESPTTIELQPGNYIQVTLFDANHCPGSVMFLIEGNGKAVLYSGDVRCEPWFVNAIARNPTLIEYTCGIKVLDNIYLDTSFTDDIPFNTKAEGIAELLHKVMRYPKDTVFYIQSWTYGYEDVWVALAKALNSPIHVDCYKLRIYNSLNTSLPDNPSNYGTHLTATAAALTGFMCGNSPQPGCLTTDQNVRLHSCERGDGCATAKHSSVVRIQPVVASFPDGGVMHEAGIGGGGEDLEREMELRVPGQKDLCSLLGIIDALRNMTEKDRIECARLMTSALASGRNLPLHIGLSSSEDLCSTDLRKAILSLANNYSQPTPSRTRYKEHNGTELPSVIQFPYARHSSYAELCDLVGAFKPKDIWPCTFHLETWRKRAISIESLFGKYCSGNVFAHDLRVNNLTEQNIQQTCDEPCSQDRESCDPDLTPPMDQASPNPLHSRATMGIMTIPSDAHKLAKRRYHMPLNVIAGDVNEEGPSWHFEKQLDDALLPIQGRASRSCAKGDCTESEDESQKTNASFPLVLSLHYPSVRCEAYERMLQNYRGIGWNSIELISTGCNHSAVEKEL
ncbi:hypothetical protein Trco_003322 [Trichoderma cornu-damae]|uniref:Metallo-beta-lactamase domain-containing protein n=1 Tax=Trichoderma cornu-damae TaxID=654480 RepID=A0A9P8QRL2_9HYPO|nr:hypothetical protein Trco_003322 [Trichoderma cornu-damae]